MPGGPADKAGIAVGNEVETLGATVKEYLLYFQITKWDSCDLSRISISDIPPLLEQCDKTLVRATVSKGR